MTLRRWRRRTLGSRSEPVRISRSRPGTSCWSRGSPLKIIEALKLSRPDVQDHQAEPVLAFVYNVAAIPLAAFGLLNPMIAAGAMALSSVSVVGNSLRIRRQALS